LFYVARGENCIFAVKYSGCSSDVDFNLNHPSVIVDARASERNFTRRCEDRYQAPSRPTTREIPAPEFSKACSVVGYNN